jgi:hypothetical protein
MRLRPYDRASHADYRHGMGERFALINCRLALLEHQVAQTPIFFQATMIGGRHRSFAV